MKIISLHKVLENLNKSIQGFVFSSCVPTPTNPHSLVPKTTFAGNYPDSTHVNWDSSQSQVEQMSKQRSYRYQRFESFQASHNLPPTHPPTAKYSADFIFFFALQVTPPRTKLSKNDRFIYSFCCMYFLFLLLLGGVSLFVFFFFFFFFF